MIETGIVCLAQPGLCFLGTILIKTVVIDQAHWTNAGRDQRLRLTHRNYGLCGSPLQGVLYLCVLPNPCVAIDDAVQILRSVIFSAQPRSRGSPAHRQ